MTAREWLRALYVPVLIGSGKAVRQTAGRLFWCYGLVSHVFCHRAPLFLRFSLFTVCHRLPRENSHDFFALALSDFADDVLAADRQPLLILCEDAPEWSALAPLESKYVVCREDHISDLFAHLIQSTQGEQSL